MAEPNESGLRDAICWIQKIYNKINEIDETLGIKWRYSIMAIMRACKALDHRFDSEYRLDEFWNCLN